MYEYEYDKIKGAANYQYSSLGYVDLHLLETMHNILLPILENVLKKAGFKESKIKGQFIKSRVTKKRSYKKVESQKSEATEK